MAWVGFEPTTSEFSSDALTDWAVRPWVQLAIYTHGYIYIYIYIYIYMWYCIYDIWYWNIVTSVPGGTNHSESLELRSNSSAKETLKTVYSQNKGSCKNLKPDWLKLLLEGRGVPGTQSNIHNEAFLQK